MKSYHFFGEKRLRSIYTLLLLSGALLVLLSLTELRRGPQVPGYYATTAGVVSDSGSARMARVRFTLPNRETYETLIPPRRSGEDTFYRQGEQVNVYYNPVDPEELVVEKRSVFGSGTLLFLGIMAGGIGFRLLVHTIMRSFRHRVIRENGKRVRPRRVEIESGTVPILPFIHRPAAYLRCEWEGPPNLGTLTFTSEAFPPRFTDRLSPEETEVYFLEHNPGVYFIPLPYSDTERQTPPPQR